MSNKRMNVRNLYKVIVCFLCGSIYEFLEQTKLLYSKRKNKIFEKEMEMESCREGLQNDLSQMKVGSISYRSSSFK